MYKIMIKPRGYSEEYLDTSHANIASALRSAKIMTRNHADAHVAVVDTSHPQWPALAGATKNNWKWQEDFLP